MKILKFGGKSLSNGLGLQNVISIITNNIKAGKKVMVVVSARGDATDQLSEMLDLATQGEDYIHKLELFKDYHIESFKNNYFEEEFELIERILRGVSLIKDYSPKVKDLLLAQGEIISSKSIAYLLNNLGERAKAVDSRLFLTTDNQFGNANIYQKESEQNTIKYFDNFESAITPIVTGFIASTKGDITTTIGRNGTNYTASLLANYLNVEAVESYTHVDGIFTANPEIVDSAKIINHINYSEASQLSNFGATILHSRSIYPLSKKNIPLKILNTFNSNSKGTLISNEKTPKGIKSISVQDEYAIIDIIGKGLLGKIGTDARIFTRLGNLGISIGIISQGSSERGVSFIISSKFKCLAKQVLIEEFKQEIITQDIQSITIIDDISVVTVVGENITNFSSSISYLKQNKISILLINNSISEDNISLVVAKKDTQKTVNVIHSQIFGAITRINIAVVGKGTVGKSLINQILKSKERILNKKNLHLNIFAVAGSKKLLLNKGGVTQKWNEKFDALVDSENHTKDIIEFSKINHLENLVVIDNTSSYEFIENYSRFIENGFDIISSNKIANTQRYEKYNTLRNCLKKYNKTYLYETNVGAGLPIIDTIRVLHESGENITRIKGVFSGSLSFLFNSFSKGDKPFSFYLKEAVSKGYTEPDPRDDLSGNDVARKLLILARELDLENEFEEIEIDNLIPQNLREVKTEEFFENLDSLDEYYKAKKAELKEGEVLRYVGDLFGDLQRNKGKLEVSLIKTSENSPLGGLKGSDSIFEIYTDSYNDSPITVIGAGAGAEVTARGVFGDLLRIADKK